MFSSLRYSFARWRSRSAPRYENITRMPTIRDKPGLRESIAFLQALVTEHIQVVTTDVIDDHLGFIARGADDLMNFELGLPRLEKAAHTPDTVAEEMVLNIFSEEAVPLREAARGNEETSGR